MREGIRKIDRNILRDAEFNRFESSLINRVVSRLDNPAEPPILTNDEDDLIIDLDSVYFGAITRSFTPVGASELVRSGEITNKEVERKQRAGRAIVRQTKSDMFVERIMTATYETDVCRSYYRHAQGFDFVPIIPSVMEPKSLEVWTKGYVEQLFQAGRERRILRGAAVVSTIDRILSKFNIEDNLPATLTLTAMTGLNARKKIDFWIDQLYTVSRGFERVNKDTEQKLTDYMASRPPIFFQKPDIFKMIADRANSE